MPLSDAVHISVLHSPEGSARNWINNFVVCLFTCNSPSFEEGFGSAAEEMGLQSGQN